MKTLSSILHLIFHGLFIWGVVEFTLFWKPWIIGWSGYIAVIFCAVLMFIIFMGSLAPTLQKLEKGN